MEPRNSVERTGNDPLAAGFDDRRAFERLFKSCYAPLCDYVHAILGDFQASEDVVQDLFTRLWRDREGLEVQGSIRSYLYASARYRALNVLKHKAVVEKNNPILAEFIENVQQEGYSEEEELKIEQINRVLEELPPRCRAVFTASCLEGRSYGEIAARMGISVNTVKFHVKRAYREIHAVIQASPAPILVLLAVKNRFL
ncbi:MAG: RNA polymerase sigma-70 factor [Odoribacteraceae bacterium]|nr:RNA polymerase sigma-70 factor [Odoribacteraceae bacterium]